LFADIGGFELGLEQAGHKTRMLCAIWEPAVAVLQERFPRVDHVEDVTTLADDPGLIPEKVDLLTAGFPCTDLSQAGMTAGIKGKNSGLVYQVFRILHRRRVPWVIIENVPFMLNLKRGRAMGVIVDELERLGYQWAYRIVDSRAFGVPQRRRRVFLVASLEGDPERYSFRRMSDLKTSRGRQSGRTQPAGSIGRRGCVVLGGRTMRSRL